MVSYGMEFPQQNCLVNTEPVGKGRLTQQMKVLEGKFLNKKG